LYEVGLSIILLILGYIYGWYRKGEKMKDVEDSLIIPKLKMIDRIVCELARYYNVTL